MHEPTNLANSPDTRQGGAVCAVIVSFRPDLPRLQKLVESVMAQADRVLIVDNGSAPDALARMQSWVDGYGVNLIELGENRGIAAAHNAGIRHAMANAFAYVLLLDHDSRLRPDCVAELRRASEHLTRSGVKVAAVGPEFHDETTGRRAPFRRYSRWGFRNIVAADRSDVIETSVLISSGSLISCASLQSIGMMDENLFIDGVDWEWCFRAAARGYLLFGIAAAAMDHSFGDSGVRVLWRTIPLHSALRHYYVYRNTVLMCSMPQVPASWKWHFSLQLAGRFAIYMLLAPRRAERLRMVWRGLCDGLRGRGGRLESASYP